MDVREKLVKLLSEKCMETCKQRKGYVCSVEECKRSKEKCCGFYADHLIANGVTVLPCKVGDTVYWVHGAVITECKVHRIQKNRNGLYICLKSNVSHGAFHADLSIGKTVFLTREEAEKVLEEMKK